MQKSTAKKPAPNPDEDDRLQPLFVIPAKAGIQGLGATWLCHNQLDAALSQSLSLETGGKAAIAPSPTGFRTVGILYGPAMIEPFPL